MPALYKAYTMILVESLRKEIEGKGIIPQKQTGFRRGMRTVVNIYALNSLSNRQLEKRGEKLVLLFVDLKVAFNSVDRGVLIGIIRKKEIEEGLIERGGKNVEGGEE